MPQSEAYWGSYSEKIGLYTELMPEPYLGDPYNCSAVIMNYNLGVPNYKSKESEKKISTDPVHHSRLSDPTSMVYHYAHNYRARVATGGYLGKWCDPMYNSSGLTKVGKCWWCKRMTELQELDLPSNKFRYLGFN